MVLTQIEARSKLEYFKLVVINLNDFVLEFHRVGPRDFLNVRNLLIWLLPHIRVLFGIIRTRSNVRIETFQTLEMIQLLFVLLRVLLDLVIVQKRFHREGERAAFSRFGLHFNRSTHLLTNLF